MKWGVRRTQEQIRHDKDSKKPKNYNNKVFEAVRNGSVSLDLHKGRQDKHVIGTNNYKVTKGKTYVYKHIDMGMLIKDLAGTGKDEISSGKKWMNKEVVESSKNIGVWYSKNGNERRKTNRLTLHYSKEGTHAVPTRPY